MTTIVDAMNEYLAMVQQRTRPDTGAEPEEAKRNKRRKEPKQNKDLPPNPIILEKPIDVETPTTRTYRNGLQAFGNSLLLAGIDPRTADIASIQEDWIEYLIDYRQMAEKSTQKLYLAAASKFYSHLVAARLAEVNLPRVHEIIGGRTRKLNRKIPDFPREEIEQLIAYAEALASKDVSSVGASLKSETGRENARRREKLRNLRDRAFILVLSDTGLRCSEACSLNRGDISRHDGVMTVKGKGGDEARVRVSQRALDAIKDYLDLRDQEHPPEGRFLKAQPLFVRHMYGAKGATKGLSAGSGWEIVKERAAETLGKEAAELIHPHSFRHYFVTIVLLATNNLEKARKLARHKSITTTQLYAEVDPELDQDYHEIFNTRRKKKATG